MSAYDMNDEITGSVMRGMEAAADRFAERMRGIHDENVEKKHSKFWHDYAKNLAKQVDDLTEVLNKQNVIIARKDVLLQKATERVEAFRNLSTSHGDYLDLLVERLTNVEDILQRQSANTFALNEFRKLALTEIETIQDPKQSALIDPAKQSVFLNKAWSDFMKTTNVKRGIPRLGIDKP